MPDRDIVDAIDELVDWQMSNYENRSGYDRNVNQVDCPHPWCYEPWHGLAITTRMREMRWGGHMDPAYRYADDDSDVLCPGSEFDGEFTPPESVPSAPYIPGPIEALLAAQALWGDLMAAATGLPTDFWQLPDDPLLTVPNPFLPSVIESRGSYPWSWLWSWSGETVTLVERRTIEAEADAVAAGEPIGQSFKDAADSYLRAAAEQGITDLEPRFVHVRIDESRSTSTHYALVATYKPPRRENAAEPIVRLWREDPNPLGEGWQELGMVDAAAVRFTPIAEPSPEARALIFTPGDQAA